MGLARLPDEKSETGAGRVVDMLIDASQSLSCATSSGNGEICTLHTMHIEGATPTHPPHLYQPQAREDLQLVHEIRTLATKLHRLDALDNNRTLKHLSREVLQQHGQQRTQSLRVTRDSYAQHISRLHRRRRRAQQLRHLTPIALLLALPSSMIWFLS